MGSRPFIMYQKAESAQEAFDALVSEAQFEHGHDRYNGSISTCSLRGRPVKEFDKYSPENRRIARELAEADSYGSKWEAKYIDLGVCGYELIEIKRETRPFSAKYRLMYVVYNEDFKAVDSDPVKGSAETKAMKYALKHNCSCRIVKEYKKMEGNNCVCTVDVKRKFFLPEDKPRLPRHPTKTLVAIHEYCFYGWASE